MIEEGTRVSLRLGAAHHCLRVRRGPGTATTGNRGVIQRRQRLGGMLNYYFRAAA
jgi:hypothetical protein